MKNVMVLCWACTPEPRLSGRKAEEARRVHRSQLFIAVLPSVIDVSVYRRI
jgi:hypothetical protein